ncbi:MAG: Uma2 family endonuclease [Phormidesmis sp. CAN_BIN44]|nr:Uma2 family endonuclease [Phormidesmis sp. CAN_BIN44]
MTQAKPRFRTIEEYLDYDDGTDTRYELVDGELIEMPPESRLNYKIASFLFEMFIRLGISSSLLTIGVQIAVSSRKTARQPDLIVLSQECADALEGMTSALITFDTPNPSLVIEVVSPGEPGTDNHDRDYIEKPKEYAARGIPEFWQVDPSRSVVIVLNLKNGAYQSREFRGGDCVISPTFPELQLTANQILRAGL